MNWRKRPSKDPTSIGNLLQDAGLISPEQMDSALTFQKNHQDILLGEALVRMGVIAKEALDMMIARQRALRTRSSKDIGKLIEVATKQTREATMAFAVSTAKVEERSTHKITAIARRGPRT